MLTEGLHWQIDLSIFLPPRICTLPYLKGHFKVDVASAVCECLDE